MTYNSRRITADSAPSARAHRAVVILTSDGETTKVEVAEATREAAVARVRLMLAALVAETDNTAAVADPGPTTADPLDDADKRDRLDHASDVWHWDSNVAMWRCNGAAARNQLADVARAFGPLRFA